MSSLHQVTRSLSPNRVRIITLLLVVAVALFAADLLPFLEAQPPRPFAMPPGARLLVIEVESVRGRITYSRKRAGRIQVRRLGQRTRLQQGDALHLDIGARCQLIFRRAPAAPAEKNQAARVPGGIRPVVFRPEAPEPKGDDVVAAVVLRGYSEVTVARAFQQGQATQTQLDLTQGIIRAGVVKTAVPPLFRIRTPRTVVAVRGTEIRELEASIDRGDILSMGRIGVVANNDRSLLTRSAQAEQGTRKETQPDRRAGRLVRAIIDMPRRIRVVVTGPHKGRIELDQSLREAQDPLDFSKAERLKANGNAQFLKFLNSSKGGGSGGNSLVLD